MRDVGRPEVEPTVRAFERSGYPRPLTALLVAILVLVLALLALGREPWSASGTFRIWYGLPNSSETSQQLFDWYTFTHLVHGVLLYGVLRFLGGKLPAELRFPIAILAEAAWEIIENTEFVIERYRAETIALQYYGDTVVNSIGDLLAAAAGYAFAATSPVWLTVGAAVGLEAWLAYAIRDNLTLNAVMLVWPLEVVKKWQSAPH